MSVQSDIARTAVLYKRAADLGNADAMASLGWLHEHGSGVELDIAKSASLYKRAVDLGSPIGMVNLGLLHVQGKGVQKNEVMAVALFRKAAGLGNLMAMNNLAWMLQTGIGVERKDPEAAAALILQAVDRRFQYSYQQMTQHSRSWSVEFRRALQKRLQVAGVYSGKIDGEFGDNTIAALNAFINRKRST